MTKDIIPQNPVSDKEYIDSLRDYIEWLEGEASRLEKEVEEFRSRDFDYENRNNCLEG